MSTRARQRTFRSGGVEPVARRLLPAGLFGMLVLAGCGDLSPEDMTAVALLEPSPTPIADVVAMHGGSPSGDGVLDARGPVFSPGEAWRLPDTAVISPPIVSGGLVFMGVADPAGESPFYLSAFDARAQRELWRFPTGREVYSAPAVSDGVVFVASRDGSVYALDAATGEEKWRFEAVGRPWASTIVADGAVFFTASDGNIYSLDAATGEERWRVEIFGPRNLDANSAGRGAWLTPSVDGGVVYAGSLDWHVYALDAATGEEKWRFKTKGPVWGSPAISNGVVYFGSDDLHLYAVDAATGAEKWKFQSHWPLKASPVAFEDTVIYQRGYVHGLDAATGEEKWRTEIAPQRTSAQPIVSGGNGLLYITSWRGVHVFDARTGKPWWDFNTEGTPSGYLTLEDDILYVPILRQEGSYLLALE